MFYLPYLSSIHEKANCIAILWTGSPHSLGSCLFRGLWATCLPHKGGGFPLSALPKDTTSELAGLFSTTSHKCRAPSREAIDTIFTVFWYDSTRGMNPRSTDCEACYNNLLLLSILFFSESRRSTNLNCPSSVQIAELTPLKFVNQKVIIWL